MDVIPPTDPDLAAIVWRSIGSASGTVVALAFIPPKTLMEFVQRIVVSFLTGIIAAPVIRDYMDWPMIPEYHVAAGAIGSFLAWWILGIVIRQARKWIESKTEPGE